MTLRPLGSTSYTHLQGLRPIYIFARSTVCPAETGSRWMSGRSKWQLSDLMWSPRSLPHSPLCDSQPKEAAVALQIVYLDNRKGVELDTAYVRVRQVEADSAQQR